MTASDSEPDDPDFGPTEHIHFLKALLGDPPDGWLTLFVIDPHTGELSTVWDQTPDGLYRAAVERADTANTWFGVAPRRERLTDGRRGAEQDCTTIGGLWADLDVVGPGHARADLIPSLDAAYELVEKFPLRPSAVIETGNGLQPWWLFIERFPVSDAGDLLTRWGAWWITQGEARGWHIDNVFDPARIMRVPGTSNRKTDPAKPVELAVWNPDTRYHVDDFEWLPDPVVKIPTRNHVPYIGPTRPGDHFNAVHTCGEILKASGWEFHHQDNSGDEHWTRPGKERRQGSSATIYSADGRAVVWTDAVPALKQRGSYDAFGLYTRLCHDGDFAAATAALVAQGYGEKRIDSLQWLLEAEGLHADHKNDAHHDNHQNSANGQQDEPATGDKHTTNDQTDEHDVGKDTTSSWEPVDLAGALDGTDIPPPTLLTRIDGPGLIYPGRTHAFHGESESMKTWAALVATVQVLNNLGCVLWVDYEDDARGVTQRLLAFGLTRDAILERFVYIRPDEPLYDRKKIGTVGKFHLDRLLASREFDLAVIDGVTEGLTTEGLDLMSNADVADWARRLPKRLAATGAGVVSLDHVIKSKEGGPSRFAIGGQHKLAGLTGAAYRFDVVRPLARATGSDAKTGVVQITVVKDRPGHVRANSFEGARAAQLEITSWPDGGITASLLPVSTDSAPDLALCRRIAEYLAQYEGSSMTKIEQNVSGNNEQKRAALRWMAAEGREWVRIERKGQAHLHYLQGEGMDLI